MFMTEIPVFKVDLKDMLQEEASGGACFKWKKILKINGKKYKVWIKDAIYLYMTPSLSSIGEVITWKLSLDLGMNNVLKYYPCFLQYIGENGEPITTIGCYSFDFTKANEEVVTLDTLVGGEGSMEYQQMIDIFMKYTKKNKETVTKFLDYMILLDSILLSEDRQLHNIGLLKNKITGAYDFAPIFDNGDCLKLAHVYLSYSVEEAVYEDMEYAYYKNQPYILDYDENFKLTHFVTTPEGQKELAAIYKHGINDTLKMVDTLFRYFGCGYMTGADEKEIARTQAIRSKRPELLYGLTEIDRVRMKSTLQRRFEVIAGRQPVKWVRQVG